MACFAGPSYKDIQIGEVKFLPVTVKLPGKSVDLIVRGNNNYMPIADESVQSSGI
jgi:hypothetical protein